MWGVGRHLLCIFSKIVWCSSNVWWGIETKKWNPNFKFSKVYIGHEIGLIVPFTMDELHTTTRTMAHGKAPKHDDIITEFYVHFWEVIGKDNLNMVMNSIKQGSFLRWITQGQITLLFKGGDKEELGSWWPILLLNVGYKIYMKAYSYAFNHFLWKL